MLEFAPLVVAAAMVYSLVSTAKQMMSGAVRDAATFVVSFGISVGVAFLLRASDFAVGVDIGTTTLASLNGASTILFGFALASLSKVGYEMKKAVDNSDSAKEPKMFTEAP